MKPVWSVTIPTYNSAEFLEETLLSVLNENIGPDKMEILVVDNCSTDSTAQIVERVGRGRIKFISNEKNIGAYGNFNRCVELANGELVHLLNSDDAVNPGFYTEYENKFAEFPEVFLISSNADLINEKSEIIGKTEPIMSLLFPSNKINELVYVNEFRTPAIVVRKTAYKRLGSFDENLVFTGDWDMWVRVISNFKGLHIDKQLCKYRTHLENETSGRFLSGEDVLDYERIFKKFEKLGYPIDKSKYSDFLKRLSAYHYGVIFRTYPNSFKALKILSSIHKRHSKMSEHCKLVMDFKKERLKTSLKKLLS